MNHHLEEASFFQSSPMPCTTTTAATVLFAVVTSIASMVWWRWWQQQQQREKQQKKSATVFPPIGPAFSDLARCLRAENQIVTMQKYGSIFCVPSPLRGIIPHQVITTDIAILKELCITQFNQYREPCTFTTRGDGFCKDTQQVVGVGVTGLKGDEWKWRKQALIKEFHRSKLLSDNNSRGLVTKIVKEGKEMCDTLHKAARKEPIAVDHVTTKAAVGVILFFLFGRDDLEFDTEQMRQSAKDLMACLRLRFVHPYYKLYQYIPGTLPFEMEGRKRMAWKIIDALVAPEIQMLLDEHAGKRPVHEHRKDGSVLASLIANEPRFVHGGVPGMIAEARVFVQAGFETTAHSLAFCMGMMAERPDLATKMANMGKSLLDKNDFYNVDSILKSLENDGDAATLAVRNFFLESVRLYPLAPALGGECLKDVTVTTSNGKTVHLAKGTMVTFPNIPLQRQLDNSPDSIIPERWNVPASQQPFLHTFQTGAHACPGRPLSMLEGQVFLLLVATQFEFTFPPGIEKVEYEDNLLLRPKNGMPLLVQKRQL